MEELVSNHLADFTRLLDVMERYQLICSRIKSKFFQLGMEFFGYVIREGFVCRRQESFHPCISGRYPKLWQLCAVFSSIPNYSSEYVPNDAEAAGNLMSKLQVGKGNGKKGSQKKIEWGKGDKKLSRIENGDWLRLYVWTNPVLINLFITPDASDLVVVLNLPRVSRE